MPPRSFFPLTRPAIKSLAGRALWLAHRPALLACSAPLRPSVASSLLVPSVFVRFFMVSVSRIARLAHLAACLLCRCLCSGDRQDVRSVVSASSPLGFVRTGTRGVESASGRAAASTSSFGRTMTSTTPAHSSQPSLHASTTALGPAVLCLPANRRAGRRLLPRADCSRRARSSFRRLLSELPRLDHGPLDDAAGLARPCHS